MYQIQLNKITNKISSITIVGQAISIPIESANTDYAAFKTYLSTPNASLQDAEGNAMTADQIATFLETLP